MSCVTCGRTSREATMSRASMPGMQTVDLCEFHTAEYVCEGFDVVLVAFERVDLQTVVYRLENQLVAQERTVRELRERADECEFWVAQPNLSTAMRASWARRWVEALDAWTEAHNLCGKLDREILSLIGRMNADSVSGL